MFRFSVPPLSYRLCRDITRWRWLAPLVYAIAIMSFIALFILNVALTAYQVILTTTNDFNATQTLWYHSLAGAPKPGTQCASANYTVGDQFTTTGNILTYTLLEVYGPNKVVSYRGTPLRDCDLISAALDGDLVTSTITSIAYVACNSTDLQITAKAEFEYSLMPSLLDNGRLSPGQSFFHPPVPGPQDFVRAVFGQVSTKFQDLLQFMAQRSKKAPWRLSIEAAPSCSQHSKYAPYREKYCNNDDTAPVLWLYGAGISIYGLLANGTQLPVVTESLLGPPTYGPNWINMGIGYDVPGTNISATYFTAITDIMQTLISAVRIDFGLVLPNNPLLNMSVLNETIVNPFPPFLEGLGRWNSTQATLTDPINVKNFNLTSVSPLNSSYLVAEYQCSFRYPFSWPQALVNVVVATFSLFTAGWGVAMFAIAWLVRRREEDNYCAGHALAKREIARQSLLVAYGERDLGGMTECPHHILLGSPEV